MFCSRSRTLPPCSPCSPIPLQRCRGLCSPRAAPGWDRLRGAAAAGGDASPSPGRLGSVRALIRGGYRVDEAAEPQRRI